MKRKFVFLLFAFRFLFPSSAFGQIDAWFEIPRAFAVPLVDSFGLMEDSATEDLGANYIDACRFQMGAVSGTLTDIRLKVDDPTISGSLKFAIYTDTTVSGYYYARTRLWADETGQTIVNGWNTVATSSVALTPDAYYWLCAKMSVTNLVQWKGAAEGLHRWKSHDYAAAWPDTIAVNSWGGTNPRTHRYLGIYTTGAVAGKKKAGGIIQDEDEGITGGGIAK